MDSNRNGQDRYAIVAGNGRFPFLVLEAAREQAIEPVVFAIQEEASPELAGAARAIHWLSLGEIAKLLDLLAKIAVLLADTAQIEVVVPDPGGATLDADNPFFKRRDHADSPDADQARRFVFGRALDLDCEAEDLQENGRRQHCDITIAAHKGVHRSSY